MKKYRYLLIIGVVGMTMQTTYAAGISIQNQSIVVPQGEKEFTVALTLTEDKPYAGAEFGLDLPEGIEIKEVSYEIDQDYMSIGPVANSKGSYYFGFFDGENKYVGTYPIIVALEKVDDTLSETSISLEALNITRVDAQKKVQTDKQVPNQAIKVKFEETVEIPEESEEVVVPPEPKVEPSSETQPVSKPELEPEIKSEVKPEIKLDLEPEIKQEIPKEIEPMQVEPKEEVIPQIELTPAEKKAPQFIMILIVILVAIGAFFLGRWMPRNKKGE